MKKIVAFFVAVVFLAFSTSATAGYQAKKNQTRKRPPPRTQVQKKKVAGPGLFFGGVMAVLLANWFQENRERALKESFRSRSAVVYKDASGNRIEAKPINYYEASGPDSNPNPQGSGRRECAKILINSYGENGELLGTEEKEVCE